MNSKQNILILSPHTDDAELGCGGSIARFIEEDKNLLWVVFSAAEESLPEGFHKDTLVNEFREAVGHLGLSEDNIVVNRYQVRYLHTKRQEILEQLIKIRANFKPDLVLGPSLNDFHQDHTIIANEMIRAFKMSASIICYELPWNHINFQTQMFMPLQEKHIEKKISLLSAYKSQLAKQRPYFSHEFVNGLAATRGAQIGEKYAEAFEVVRWIN